MLEINTGTQLFICFRIEFSKRTSCATNSSRSETPQTMNTLNENKSSSKIKRNADDNHRSNKSNFREIQMNISIHGHELRERFSAICTTAAQYESANLNMNVQEQSVYESIN